ncbi:glycerophosphodiester phosphodiesterase [Glaciibacter psychrotolerans]|uniref:Glycerophosphoryl diester phosphodiesterase n=1 Tax=Glaciibacter psychrotolerans TaxID=670054 RepID=A0A7Z0EEG8_9MICO|nr:glycerophosphodiester phosphodiesterase family protein [Leifsonia psychrotolerans]NYJ20008.1 glycerophosphoryl diester phosphodiesterase [Leifsonia psychrotolerans]
MRVRVSKRLAPLIGAVTAVAVLVPLLIVSSVPGSVSATDVFGALRTPGEGAFIAGHRGDRAAAPENTMPAFELAMASEMDFVETDVQLTSDGVPVLFHDVDLKRTTNGRGRVAEHTAAQIATLDAGSWYGSVYAGTRIPTLEEFFATLRTSHKKALVELKFGWSPDQLRGVIDAIERHDLRSRVVLQSFSIETLLNLQAVAPTYPRIMLVRELSADPVPMAKRFGVIGVATTARSVAAAPGAVNLLHEAGFGVICYTLNTQETWAEVRQLGIDGIITDTPSELDSWLAATSSGT